jgi:predicted phage tail protein
MTYNDTAAANGNTYVYVVKAVNTLGSSPASNSATGSPGVAPGPPTGFIATGHRNQITLNWTAPVGGGVSNYLVYRGTTAGGEGTTPIATVTGITYEDDNVVAGTPYYYKVKANNSHGQSTFTEERSATATPSTAPSAPLSLVATPGPDKITLTWTAPADNGGSPITGYQIWRSTGTGAASQLATVGASTRIYNDTSGTEGTNYTYYVKAVNAIGAGAQSNAQTAAPEGPSAGIDDTLLLVGIGAVVVIVIIILAYMLMRRGKSPKSP